MLQDKHKKNVVVSHLKRVRWTFIQLKNKQESLVTIERLSLYLGIPFKTLSIISIVVAIAVALLAPFRIVQHVIFVYFIFNNFYWSVWINF